MNTLYAVPNDNFWQEIATGLKNKYGLVPKFWLHDEFDKREKIFNKCTYYNAWKAKKMINQPENNQSYCYSDLSKVNFDRFSISEYYNFLKILDRGRAAQSFVKRDRYFKEQIRYWGRIIISKEIKFIFFSNIPHLHVSYPLYLCAKKMGVKIAFFNFTTIKGVCYLNSDIENDIKWQDYDDKTFNTYQIKSIKNKLEKSIKDIQKKGYDPFYMLRQKEYDKKYIGFRQWFLVGELLALKTSIRILIYKLFNIDIFKKFSKHSFPEILIKEELSPFNLLSYNRKKDKYLKKLLFKNKKHSTNNPNLNTNYIFFPLHYQPEASSAPLGALFSDQIYLTELISDCLPLGWKIYIKEHYTQYSNLTHGQMGRYYTYYDDIAKIDNVEIIDLEYSTKKMILNCKAVSTISGTAGWEGLVYGKPCLLFGNAWYSTCPGVIRIRQHDEVYEAIRKIDEYGYKLKSNFEHYIDDIPKALIEVDLYNLFKGEISRNPQITTQYIARFLRLKAINSLL